MQGRPWAVVAQRPEGSPVNVRFMPLDQLRPGMVLGADIEDAHGAVLLAAGSEISEALLAALRRRGVEQVSVRMPEQSSGQEEARREEARARLAHLFRRAGDGEAVRSLHAVVLAYREGQAQ